MTGTVVQGWCRQRTVDRQRITFANGLTAGSGIHRRLFREPVVPAVMTCTATFIVFFSGSPTA